MTTTMTGGPVELLAPITATLRSTFGTDHLPGLAPGLLIGQEPGWLPSTELITGDRLPALLADAERRWHASPHTAAALTWKAYSYWLTLPVVLGWASARRVPLVRPADVLFRTAETEPALTLGLRPTTAVAVLPGDPLVLIGHPGLRVVADEAELLATLRATLLDGHLAPLLAALRANVRLGARTLLGSLAAAVAQGIVTNADALPGCSARHVDTLLDALGLTGLIELVPGPTGALSVQRKTCCLAFTLPEPKICHGCCLRP
jgi:hypothetical protein